MMARLWDATTGQPIGQPMPHFMGVSGVAFSSAGRVLLTTDGWTMWRWDAPAPLPDDLPRLAAWVEAAAGLELDERGSIRCSTAMPGWSAVAGWSRSAGRHRPIRRCGGTRSSSARSRGRGATPGKSEASGIRPRRPTPRPPAPDRLTWRFDRPWPACTSSAAISTVPRRHSPRGSG